MSREAWCAEKLSRLQIEDLRIETLSELKDYLTTLSQDEAYQVANSMQLPVVFDCLNDSKTEQIDLACDVLTLCMNSLTLGESTSRYGTALERALHHPSLNAKLMALKEIYRTALNSDTIGELSQQIPILLALVTCVGDPELSVAKYASDILILVGKNREGLRQLLIPEVKKSFAETIMISDIVRFRIYEIVVNIASHNEENLQNILTTGLISSLVSELDNDDVLLKLNVIELLSVLAGSNHGLIYLQGEKIIDKLHIQLATINEDPLGNLVAPGLLRFFGNVAYWRPAEIYSLYPASFTILFDVIIRNDVTLLGIAYDTLGHIGSTTEGKITLAKSDKPMAKVLQTLGSSLSSLTSDLRIRALNCIENLIRVEPTQLSPGAEISRRWFNYLSVESLAIIFKYAQNPFGDLRMAGLNIVQALSELTWGQEAIKNQPGLLEFLLDRRIETLKETKEIKYDIVKCLSESSVFDEDTLAKLRKYVLEGPFYVQVITEVAIEGSG